MFAHSPNDAGDWHLLREHLRGASALAREYAGVFGGGDIAAALAYWHDVGKANPDWQAYLRRAATDPSLRGTGPEHSLAGTLLAWRHPQLRPFAFAIAGHHGGLPSRSVLVGQRLSNGDAVAAAESSLRLAQEVLPDLDVNITSPMPLASASDDPRVWEHLIRMVFSAVVDADFIDTERHFDPARTRVRESAKLSLATLRDRLLADQRTRFGLATGRMADTRREIFAHCIEAAQLPPGIFRLTVPTGGGKTRAALAFALDHAARYGKRRVILAVPFLSITDQTARVYREVFPEPGIVLEHHSGFDGHEDESPRPEVTWSRLAAENWDAPIVVTTTVQLFESLFANRPSRTRKLHNIAGSVLILDEVQSLPIPLLAPTLEMLEALARYYGVTVVLSSATQPAYEVLPGFAGLSIAEIVPDPGRYFSALQRVSYDARITRRVTWDEVGTWLAGEHQALVVVNTKSDAVALLDAAQEAGVTDVLHLSTLLCGAHRRRALEEIHRRLSAGEPCVVISTQVVEAGVDVDFPAVYRAIGPLDSIIQAAGRCNREFKLDRGRVILFDPAEGRLPSGAYRVATDQTRAILQPGIVEIDSVEVISRYYLRFLVLPDIDNRNIQAARDQFDYPEVGRRYRLIDDDTEAVVIASYVQSHGSAAESSRVTRLIEEARTRSGSPRQALRGLQPYIVEVRRREIEAARAAGLAEEIVPGLNIWLGRYDDVRGLMYERAESLVI